MTRRIANRFSTFSKSIFSQMTELALERNALNLAQGFPDFPGPPLVINKIEEHLRSCDNQYTRSAGHPFLCSAIVNNCTSHLPRNYDFRNEVTITNGATEGLFCAINGLVNPGDGVLVFEPYYESYATCVAAAGAKLIGSALGAPVSHAQIENGDWQIDWHDFDKKIKSGISAIILNTPHNPTGKVFSHEELKRIFAAAKSIDAVVIIDGVYENLTFGSNHAKYPTEFTDDFSRVIYVSSVSKTLSFTGFKVGWVLAPENLMDGIRRVHEATVFCTSPHLQLGMCNILSDQKFMTSYLESFRKQFLAARDFMRKVLTDFGFVTPAAAGTYFLLANADSAPIAGNNDHELAMDLLKRFNVASLPVSGFYVNPPADNKWLRFAFCKSPDTIRSLADHLAT